MDDEATPNDSARSQAPITEEADNDDDSSSAYGRTIWRIIQKTRRMSEPRLSLPLVQFNKAATGSGGSQQSQLQYETNYDNQSNASVSELNFKDNNSYRNSVIFSPDYETRSLYSIVECEPDNLYELSSNNFAYFDTASTYNNRMMHNQDETSFISPTPSLVPRNETQLDRLSSNCATTCNARVHVDHQTMDTNERQPRQQEQHRMRRKFLKCRLGGARSLPRFSDENGQQQQLNATTTTVKAGQRKTNKIILRRNDSSGANNYPAHSAMSTGAQSNDDLGTESADDPDLHTMWSWRNLKREFKLSHSESLFHLYHAKLQQSFFVALLILNIIFNLGAVISYVISKYHQINIYLIIMRSASIYVMIAFLVLIWYNKAWMQSKFSRTVASLAVLMAMIFGEASGAICALMNDQATPLASIRRTYYLIITNHVFLPFPSRIQACATTIIITSFEIVVTYISRRDNNCRADYLTLYSIADIIFYASSAMIGFQITFLLEIAIRRTFLNHKYCIQSTYKLNYEKEQQEQLLRSCFPQHLIEQVRDDIRQSIVIISKRQSQPFRPFYNLYVKKYENVTILYADIVNSMNLTDKLNPGELVETLNELYGRFDELAEKYNCLRIKLLGDCYYCVSGLPKYDEEHALKCLLMGLGMIKIIQSIRQMRNVNIDMRIGIHSGSVLSGLLGLRKWQFDIWSFDAMKASAMEHSGQPGFVHITQRTLDLISKDKAKIQDFIITATRQSDDSETTYLISERVSPSEQKENARACKRNGQTEKLKAYIEKLRLRPAANAMDITQRRMALETSLKKYREIHEKVDETMKTAIAEMPLGRHVLTPS